jgi:spermidine synthase
MRRRWTLALCLIFSGLAALVYQVIWTRLMGFAFGTTTEAIGTVLAVFFGGMALGNAWAARRIARLERPLRVYALLELGIGAFALASLPLLRHLDVLYTWVGPDHGPVTSTALRVAAAAAVLLPPTFAMGATLPVVARGLVERDDTLGRWSAVLYAANTLGAVLGAYLSGFWLIPSLGLARSIVAAAAVNLLVAGAVLALAGRARVPAMAAPPSPPRDGTVRAAGSGERIAFLAFFCVSGFVAIGYEIVWSKVFGIVMEGTLYGFAAVLSSYLLGIALGSLAVSPFVDRLRDLPRAFGLLHLGIAACVALGMAAVPYLPWALHRLARATEGRDAVHLLFVLVAPIVIAPTALFGAAFPILIRIYTSRAERVGEGMGVATAVNTTGSIAASLLVGFWWIPAAGMDATLYALLMLDLAVAALVLLRFQATRGSGRLAAAGAAAGMLLLVASSYGGVRVDRAIAGRMIQEDSLARYQAGLRGALSTQSFFREGRTSVVTVYRGPDGRGMRTNGLPEAGVSLAPPYAYAAPVLLGAVPYLLAERPERALVVGLGGGNTLDALLSTRLRHVTVVELEPAVVEAQRQLWEGRTQPLDDPRVELRLDDGRHELLLGRHRGGPGYDLIASQPSHPWLSGAANLFTREFFALARDNLTDGGVFALWLNGFRTDAQTFLAVLDSFEEVFPGALLLDVSGAPTPRNSLMLVGMRHPVGVDVERVRARLAEPELARRLREQGVEDVEDVLARFEGPAPAFAAIEPALENTDDNAFVEVRVPRMLEWKALDFAAVEGRLAPDAPALPPVAGRFDPLAVARSILALPASGDRWPFAGRLDRLLRQHVDGVDPALGQILRAEGATLSPATLEDGIARLRALAEESPRRAEVWRALGTALAARAARFDQAHAAFARAFDASGAARDAFDAGRALYRVDPAAAWAWFDRVPAAERPGFPRFAFYDAERALREGRPARALAPIRERLVAYRNELAPSAALDEVHELLAELADRCGDAADAESWRRLVREARRARAEDAFARAKHRLAKGDLDAAEKGRRELAGLAPGDPRAALLGAEIALARRDSGALESALGQLRLAAPSFLAGIAFENRFRREHGLPLLTRDEVEARRGAGADAGGA